MASTRLIVHSAPTAEWNIALDEALMASVAQTQESAVRLWESPKPVVYLGIGRSVSADVQEALCDRDGLSIVRRFTGGGTVLHMPGNINFTFAVHLARHPQCSVLADSYRYFFNIIKSLLAPWAVPLSCHGSSDLCIGDKKISGNAQARRGSVVLHHGTLLMSGDLMLITRYLKEPDRQPDYRSKRSHQDFITTLSAEGYMISFADVCKRLPTILEEEQNTCSLGRNLDLSLSNEESKPSSWGSVKESEFTDAEQQQAAEGVASKYSLHSWNRKY